MPKQLVPDPKARYKLPAKEDVRSIVGQRIRALRKKHKMTQTELAQNLGKKTPVYIGYLEAGNRDMRMTDLVRLAHHLRVDLSYFYP